MSRVVDDAYRAWAVEQPEWSCLICGEPAVFCHLKSRGAGGSDYAGYPACNSCHMDRDHTPRGERHRIRSGTWDLELANWYFNLPCLLGRYYLWAQDQEIRVQPELQGLIDGWKSVRVTG